MRRGKLYLFLAVMIIVPLLLVGCHGTGTWVPAATITDGLLQEAIDAGVALTPQPSAPDSDCATALLALLVDSPDSREEIAAALENWTDRAAANPEQAACQLGLCLMMLARALDNVAIDLGYDLFEELDNVNPLAVMAMAASDSPGGLVAAYRNLFSKSKAGVNTTGAIPGVDFTSEEVEAAIRAHLLPVIYNVNGGVYQRLVAFADSGQTEALVTLGIPGSETYTLYACDFNMMAAGMQGLRGFLLQMMAYEWAPGNWTVPEEPDDWDTDQDGLLTPSEYLPAAPFGTLHPYGQSYMADALTCYRDAVDRAITATDTIPDDPTDLLNILFGADLGNILALAVDPPETTLEAFQLILACFDALLEGEQTLVLQYWNEGEQPQQMDFRVDITQVYLNPITDIRLLLPDIPVTDLDYIIVVSTQNGNGDQVVFSWDMFPDLTFNGVFPDLPAAIDTISDYDYMAVVYADQIWGPIPINAELDSDGDIIEDLLDYIMVVLAILAPIVP